MVRAQMCGSSFEASATPQKTTRPMKPCPITAKQSPIPSPRLASLSIITPRAASSTWQKRAVFSTTFSKNAPKLDNASCTSMNMFELLSAVQKMKSKGAAGPDNIPPTFLKSFSLLALQELLSIFNASFHLADFSRIWRVAIIIPLLKSGKSPSEVASLWPISLPSYVAKLLEHTIKRLYYITESTHLFSPFQVGFHEGRSGEDQILRIVQVIVDEFQQRSMQCSVLMLLDFSKEYDTVWLEILLLCMLGTGITMTFICWLCYFLTNHRACVQLHNVCSSSCLFNQGLPQGFVLASLLFLFHIKNLAENLSNDAVIELFADDVSILTTAGKKEDCVAAAQSEVNKVYD